MPPPSVTVGRRRFLVTGFIILLLLNIGNAASLYLLYQRGVDFGMGIIPLFNFDREANLPTFFNGALLGIGAALAWACSCAAHHPGERVRKGWFGVALILAFLCLDENCRLHESVDAILMRRLHTEGAVAWPWVIPYTGLVIGAVLFFGRFFWGLERRHQIVFGVAGALYAGSALGMEMVGAAYTAEHGIRALGYGILYTIEESGEMLAVLIADWGLLGYLMERVRGPVVTFAITP